MLYGDDYIEPGLNWRIDTENTFNTFELSDDPDRNFIPRFNVKIKSIELGSLEVLAIAVYDIESKVSFMPMNMAIALGLEISKHNNMAEMADGRLIECIGKTNRPAELTLNPASRQALITHIKFYIIPDNYVIILGRDWHHTK